MGAVMKRLRIKPLIIALVVVVATSLAMPAGAISAKKGEVAPDFELSDLSGNTVKLSDYKGKVVFLAFWASWCPRCMDELVFLQGLYTVLSEEMVVLAINQETKNVSEAHRELLKDELAGLNDELRMSIQREEYERAAEIRDKIRLLEQRQV